MTLNDTWKHTPEVPQINGKGAETLQQEFLGMRLPNVTQHQRCRFCSDPELHKDPFQNLPAAFISP